MDTSAHSENKKNKKFHHQVTPAHGLIFVNKGKLDLTKFKNCDVCGEAFGPDEKVCRHLKNLKLPGKYVTKKLTRAVKVQIKQNIEQNWKNAREKVEHLRKLNSRRCARWRARNAVSPSESDT